MLNPSTAIFAIKETTIGTSTEPAIKVRPDRYFAANSFWRLMPRL